jgi:nucleotide-binding universal stress UspA family protein
MKPAKKILVGLKEAGHAAELIGLASRVGAARARVTALYVVEVPPATPLDARSSALDAPARKVAQAVELARRKFRDRVKLRVLRARDIGRTLVDELKEGRYDLAILGYHHKKTLTEILLGTTAQYVAKHAPCPLLLSIPPRR